MRKITEPGIYPDFPEADYFADPCPVPSLTQSICKVLVDQSELHARAEHPRFKAPDADEDPEKYVAAQAIGNAAHAVMIGRGKTLAVHTFDNWMSKDAKAAKAEALSKGQVPILEKHMDVAHRMVLSARQQLQAIADIAAEPALHDAFVKGDGEVVIAAQDGGIWFRSLIDWMVSPTILFDYKTTGMSVAPHAVPNLMADAGWPVQAAMQERIFDLLAAKASKRRFFFVAQENYEPFALTVHELTHGPMVIGRKMLDKAESMWRAAIVDDRWPGYAPLIHRPEYPGWKESQYLNREIAEAGQSRAPQQLMPPV